MSTLRTHGIPPASISCAFQLALNFEMRRVSGYKSVHALFDETSDHILSSI